MRLREQDRGDGPSGAMRNGAWPSWTVEVGGHVGREPVEEDRLVKDIVEHFLEFLSVHIAKIAHASPG
jgi:hypothetical protein